MAGFTHFRTPSGIANLIDDAPYGWGADMLAVYFRCDPAHIQQLLPGSLKVADGLCMAYIGTFQSVSKARPKPALHNPAAMEYREAAISIACTHDGRPGYFPTFMWVDHEWSLMRGLLNGFPKKMAEPVLSRPHRLNPLTGGLAEGAAVGGICSRHGFTLLQLGLEIERRGTPDDLPSRPATFGHRLFPAWDPSQSAVSELVEVNRSQLVVDDVWLGRAELRLGEAPDEELSWFTPEEIVGGATYSYGFVIEGARVIEPLLP
jgi:acetoacetate decarboxylase